MLETCVMSTFKIYCQRFILLMKLNRAHKFLKSEEKVIYLISSLLFMEKITSAERYVFHFSHPKIRLSLGLETN